MQVFPPPTFLTAASGEYIRKISAQLWNQEGEYALDSHPGKISYASPLRTRFLFQVTN